MLISEEEKKSILSLYKRNIILEQNFQSSAERILKFLDSKIEKYLDRLLPKTESTIQKRLESYISSCATNTKDGAYKLLDLVVNISNINSSFAKDFTKSWETKLDQIYNSKKSKKEGLQSIEKLFGKNIRTEFESLKLKNSFVVTQPIEKKANRLVLSDILSKRVENTIWNEKVKTELENFLDSTLNDKNYHIAWDKESKKQVTYFVSQTGEYIPSTYLDWYIKGHISGHEIGLNDNLLMLPLKLADGSEFRNKIQSIVEKNIPDFNLGEIPPMDLNGKWKILEIYNESQNNLMLRQRDLISKLIDRCNNYWSVPFDQTKIKIIGKQFISGRNVFEIELPKGDRILCYESSGSNTETTGKKSGEWFVIPGFGKLYENGQLISDNWFIKTTQNIAITTKNPYFKDLDMYLRAIHGYQ